MGQRHQIYFVLPVDPDADASTRAAPTIVGLHHQWLYGSQPLRKLDQLLAFVQSGIAAGNTHYMRDKVPSWLAYSFNVGSHADSEPVRALHAIYSLDLAEGGYASLHTLDAETVADPRRGDNNDGITIVDLREPATPRFAFMFFDAGDRGVASKLQLKPMSAATYLSQYYARDAASNPDGLAKSWELADKLDASYGPVTLATIRKLFPAMFKKAKIG